MCLCSLGARRGLGKEHKSWTKNPTTRVQALAAFPRSVFRSQGALSGLGVSILPRKLSQGPPPRASQILDGEVLSSRARASQTGGPPDNSIILKLRGSGHEGARSGPGEKSSLEMPKGRATRGFLPDLGGGPMWGCRHSVWEPPGTPILPATSRLFSGLTPSRPRPWRGSGY